MTTLDAILAGIVAEPDPATWLVLADWLEEHHDPRRAELTRLHERLLATCCEPEKHPERTAWQTRVVELLGQVQPCVPQRTVVLGPGVEMMFNFIPPGSFLMGPPPHEQGRQSWDVQHRVTLTKGYFLGTRPVTRGQFAWFARASGYVTHAEREGGSHYYRSDQGWTLDPLRNWKRSGFDQSDNHPAVCLTWNDCIAICEWLTAQAAHGESCCLPTEAQWEYSCRAGTTTPFHFGETLSKAQANYDSTRSYNRSKRAKSPQGTTPVDRFPPNAWGLYDLHGNVGEWCSDWFMYSPGDAIDPKGAENGTERVQRGGSFNYPPVHCRSASQAWTEPDTCYDNFGCRVCLCLK